MGVLIFSGAWALFCGLLLWIAPRAIVKLGEIANRIFMVDDFPIRHHVLTGVLLIVLSIVLFVVGIMVSKQ
jgi:hypothetical protein